MRLAALLLILPACTSNYYAAPSPQAELSGAPDMLLGAVIDALAAGGEQADLALAHLQGEDLLAVGDLLTADLQPPADLSPPPDLHPPCGAPGQPCCPGNECELPARCLVQGNSCSVQITQHCVMLNGCGTTGGACCDADGNSTAPHSGFCAAGRACYPGTSWHCIECQAPTPTVP